MGARETYPETFFRWVINVIQMACTYYGRVPISVLYEIFKNGEGAVPMVETIGKEDFDEMVRYMLSINNPSASGTAGTLTAGLACRVKGSEVISLGNAGELEILKMQKKDLSRPHRILTYDEVCQMTDRCYIRTPATDAFEDYLKREWGKSGGKAAEMTRHVVIGFRTGNDLPTGISEFVNTLDAEECTTGQNELQKITGLMADLYDNTGKMSLYGWTPLEMAKQVRAGEPSRVAIDRTGFLAGPLAKKARFILGSSRMAAKMKPSAERSEKKRSSFGMGEDSQKAGYEKVYPNDPCPCGSGKKYKHCHGR